MVWDDVATLVAARVRFMGKDDAPATTPKESVAGGNVAVAATGAPAARLPGPIAVRRACAPPSVMLGLAVFTTADFNCAGVKAGFFCFTSATAPATMPTAKLVPVTPDRKSTRLNSSHRC